jgi:hypothetical protein
LQQAKHALFDRIATLGSGVERVDENTFKYSRPAVEREMGDVGEVIRPPLWVELQGQLVTPVDGIDMATGASFGLYGPMNQENATGGVRHNYLIGETIRFSAPPTLLPAMIATLLMRRRR